MARNYWLLVSTPENFRVTRQHGFSVQGFKSRHRKKAQRMEPGDRLLFYLTGAQQFAAAATITSTLFEDHSPLWTSAKEGGEDYPFRVHINPDAVLEEGQFLDARQIGPRMDYVRKWPPEHWQLAFQGNLHLIPKTDFLLIEEEMRKVSRRAAPAP